MHDYDVIATGTQFYAEVFNTRTAQKMDVTQTYTTRDDAATAGEQLATWWDHGYRMAATR